MRYVISTAFFLLSQLPNLFSQSSELKNVIPPSPNTASLGKYGEIPVGLYTGIPNISIPLYEINDGQLKLPISLSYHASGVKVEEIPSAVGSGWALNAGGVVGVWARGIQDELGNWYPQSPSNTMEGVMGTGNPTQIMQLVNDVYDGHRDGEADVYYYNVNQQSGKFFFDQAGGVHTYPSKNIVISRTGQGWQIITEDGTVYSFTKAEQIHSSGCSEDDRFIYSAWYLTSIKSADGKKEITFTYEEVWIVSTTLLGQVKYFMINGSGTASCFPNPPPCLGSNQSRTHRLKRIDFSGGYVTFTYNNVRCDLVDDKSLDLVEVYTKNNELLKRFTLTHSYFGNNSDGAVRWTENSKRLTLESIVEQSPVSSKPPYIFEYETSISLPDRLSYAQDHWGYFNGKFNNPDLIASFTTVTPSGTAVYPGADRKANAATTQAGILKKIKYPTGGETLFTYENNTVSDNRVEPDYTETGIPLSASNYPVSNLPTPYESGTLVIPSQGATIIYSVSGLESWPWQGCDIVQCQVIKDNNPTPFRVVQNSLHATFDQWPAGTYKLRLVTECGIDATANFSVYITARIATTESLVIRTTGGLRIKQIEDKPASGYQSVIRNYKYYPDGDPAHSSGVLVNFPDYGYDLGIQHYAYEPDHLPIFTYSCQCRVRQSFSNYPLATTQGSYVGYSHVIEDFGSNGETRHSFVAYENFPGGNNYPFAPSESFDWRRGFELSAKYYALKNNQLVLVKEVTNMPYGTNEFRIYGIKTGKNLVKVLDGPTGYDPWTESQWTHVDPIYSYYPTITEFSNAGQIKERVYDQTDPNKFIETVTDYTYSPQHLQIVQARTSTSSSDQTIKDEVVVNKKYAPDYTFTGTPSGSEAAGIKKLQDLHVVSLPVEEYTLRQNRNSSNNQLSNQRITKSMITTYKTDNPYPDQLYRLETNTTIPLATFGTGSGISSNSFIKSSNSTIANSFKSAMMFNSYDNIGNLTMQQKTNDVLNSYIWDYNNSYPIAQTAGSDVANTAYTSFEADGTGGWSFSGLKFTDGSAPTGKKVYNLGTGTISKSGLASQTYIVSYWSKSGAQTVNGSAATAGRSVSGWTYYEHKVVVSGGGLSVAGSGIIDELRLYPDKALMTTYTYDPLVGIKGQCDPNNRITYFEYDEFGRLILTRDQDKNILKKICYNYAGQTENCNIYYNTFQGSMYTKNNCPPGYAGSWVGYNIPPNTYSSTLSVADANAKALADISANGQAYANATGTCTASCSFSPGYGFSLMTSSISLSGSTVSFYIVFNSNTAINAGNSYLVATINGSCRPSVTRTINYSTGGRNWTITIYPSGQMYWFLQYGSPSLPAYYTVGTGTLTYGL